MDIEHLTPVTQLKGHRAPVITLRHAKKSFLGDKILASGSEDNTCRLWDLSSNKVVKAIRGLNEPVTSISFASKADLPLLYLSSGTKVLCYDLRMEAPILTEPKQTYEFSQDEINSIDVNESNKFLATGDDQGVVNIIDLNSHKIYKKTAKKHNSICMAVRFRYKKPWEVWSGGMDSKLYQWDFSRGLPTEIHDMNAKEPSAAQMFNPPFVYSVSTSSDGKWIGASLGDGTIQLLSPQGKKRAKNSVPEDVRLQNGHNSMTNCLSFIDTERGAASDLISGSANGRMALWDLAHIESDTADPKAMYQLDSSMTRLNWLESFDVNGSNYFAAAGVCKAAGALNIYSLSLQ